MRQEEHAHQVTLFEWAALAAMKEYPELSLLFAVPNGGKRSKVTAALLKAEGVKSGVPDVWLPVARGPYHGCVIEMKKPKGEKPSDTQRWWIDRLTHQGYYVDTCYGFESAREKLEWYLGLK
jgi:hypothetical protein